MGPGLFCPPCPNGTGSFLGKNKKDPVPFGQGGKNEHKTRFSTTTKPKHSIPR